MAEPLEDRVGYNENRLDVHDSRITRVEHETDRVRDRLHALEQDRVTLELLATATRELGERVRELAAGIDAIAERAVVTVLRKQQEADWENRRHGWQFFASWAGWAAVACAVFAWLTQHYH